MRDSVPHPGCGRWKRLEPVRKSCMTPGICGRRRPRNTVVTGTGRLDELVERGAMSRAAFHVRSGHLVVKRASRWLGAGGKADASPISRPSAVLLTEKHHVHALVRERHLLWVINNKNCNCPFPRFRLQSKLVLDGLEQAWNRGTLGHMRQGCKSPQSRMRHKLQGQIIVA